MLTVQAGGSGTATQPELIAEIGNILAVQNGPTQPSTFTLDAPMLMTRLRTYHWNDARGRTPGTIALERPGGQRLGPWPAFGEPGQGGVPNANWVVEPAGVRLQPGTWRVIDSDAASWSHNAASGGAGFFALYGIRDAGAPPRPIRNPPAAAAPTGASRARRCGWAGRVRCRC